MRKRCRVWLRGSLVVLLVALGLQLIPVRSASRFEPPAELNDYFPDSQSGWVGRDLPLASTEQAAAFAEEVLGLSDCVNRVYEKNGRHIQIYVAFWAPRRAPVKSVAAHYPDICWVASGWELIERREERLDVFLSSSPILTQIRRFSSGGVVEHVLYWHLNGGVDAGYRVRTGNVVETLYGQVWANFWRDFKGRSRAEQFFVRINSDLAPDELLDESITRELLVLMRPMFEEGN